MDFEFIFHSLLNPFLGPICQNFLSQKSSKIVHIFLETLFQTKLLIQRVFLHAISDNFLRLLHFFVDFRTRWKAWLATFQKADGDDEDFSATQRPKLTAFRDSQSPNEQTSDPKKGQAKSNCLVQFQAGFTCIFYTADNFFDFFSSFPYFWSVLMIF